MSKVVYADNVTALMMPTTGIKDSATRQVIDTILNILNDRSGFSNSDSPDRFVTAGEFEKMTNDALATVFSGGAIPGANGKPNPTTPQINQAIDILADSIRKSILYQILGQQFDNIDFSDLYQKLQQAQAGIDETRKIQLEKDMALASSVLRIWASIGGSDAIIADSQLAAATPTTATATKWDQVVASVTDPNTGNVNSASIKQELNAYASNADSTFNAIYSVRAQLSVDGRTIVGGFGLSATTGAGSAGGPSIDFIVRADKFAIAATSSTPSAADQIAQGNSIPFMVLTTSQTVNGILYPPGVYMKKAVIGDATIGTAQIADANITTAKIGDAQITNAKIGDAQITTAKIGDAQVDTLKILGNAVTVPVSAAAYDTISDTATPTVALTCPAMPSVGTIQTLIIISIKNTNAGFFDTSESSGASVNSLKVRKNGIVIREFFTGRADFNTCVTMSFVDVMTGPDVYDLIWQAGATGTGYGSLSDRTMAVIGLRR